MLFLDFRQPKLWFGLLLLLTILYSGSLYGPYILDDSHTIEGNAVIQSPRGFIKAWTSGKAYSTLPSNFAFRPFSTFTSSLLWQMGSGSPFPFHFFKLILFTLICVFLVKIWRILLPKLPEEVLGAGILLFAVNPVHTQVNGYLSATATSLAAVFICSAIWFYLKYRGSGRFWDLFLSGLSILLATLSKEEGVVAIGIIPCIEIYLARQQRKRLINKRSVLGIAFLVLPALLGVGLIAWMYEPTQGLVRVVSPVQYFMTQWRAYLRYMAMYFVSYDLNADNLQFGFSLNWRDSKVLAAAAGNLIVIGLALFSWRRWPAVTLAVAWFYIGISPASSVVVLAEPVNDHRAFIGYLGFAMIGLLFLNLLWTKNRQVFYSLVTVLFLSYSVQTYLRAQIWGSNELVWRDTVNKNPESVRALNNLGLELLRQLKLDESLALLKKCSDIGPRYSHCYTNRALAFVNLGRDDEADAEFLKAVAIDQTKVQSRYNYARFLMARGFVTKPIVYLKEADDFGHGFDMSIRMDLISLYQSAGNIELAKRLWLEASKTFAGHPGLARTGRPLGLVK